MDPTWNYLDGLTVENFTQRYSASKQVGTDECNYDDKPLVALEVGTCVCIFFEDYSNGAFFGCFHVDAVRRVSGLGELPPAYETLQDFLEAPGADAMFAVVSGADATDQFFQQVWASVTARIPAERVLEARIPIEAGYCDITFHDRKVTFIKH